MIDEKLLEQINRGYVCPPHAGPALRAAREYGFDISRVEGALRPTPEQRLDVHQGAGQTPRTQPPCRRKCSEMTRRCFAV
jgi:hypothetical protein